MKLRADGIIFAAALLVWSGDRVSHWELIGHPQKSVCEKEVVKRTKLGSVIETCKPMNQSDFEFLQKNAGNIVWERE